MQGGWDSERTAEGAHRAGTLLEKFKWMAAPQLRVSGKGSVSFLFSQRLFSGPSVLTSQRTDARNAALKKKKTPQGPAGENWAKLAAHILSHIMKWHLNRESRQETVVGRTVRCHH